MPPVPGKAVIKWYGAQQTAGLRTALYNGLRAAAEYGRTEVVKAISKPSRIGGGGRRRPGFGLTKAGKKRGRGKPQMFNRSKPGQPPKRDTGKLAQSIFWSADRSRLMATVGTMLKYGVYLEKGATIPARTPKRKKVLVFSVGGDWVYTKKAKGFRLAKRPYLYSTLRRHKSRILGIIQGHAKAYSARGGVGIGGVGLG